MSARKLRNKLASPAVPEAKGYSADSLVPRVRRARAPVARPPAAARVPVHCRALRAFRAAGSAASVSEATAAMIGYEISSKTALAAMVRSTLGQAAPAAAAFSRALLESAVRSFGFLLDERAPEARGIANARRRGPSVRSIARRRLVVERGATERHANHAF